MATTDFPDESAPAALLAMGYAPHAHQVFVCAHRDWAEAQMHEAGLREEAIQKFSIKKGEAAQSELGRVLQQLGPIAQPVSR